MLLALLLGCEPLVAPAPDPGAEPEAEPDLPQVDLGGVTPDTIVIIQVDTLRMDATPWGGSERETFPRLAGKPWVSVRHAVAEGTWTAPSSASLLTSVGQEQHGVRAFDEGSGEQTPVLVPTWASWLQSQGWSTALFAGSQILVVEESSLGEGFDQRILVNDEPRNAEGVVGQGVAWLRELPADAPALLFLHPVDPHGPYRPADRDVGTWVDPATLPFDPEDPDGQQAQDIFDAVAAAPDTEERAAILDRVRRAYDEQLLGLDRSLAILFAALEDSGRLDSTVVVLTADHGESLLEGEPIWLGHGGVIRPEIVKIPLLFWTAGTAAADLDCVASNLDVFPTVVDAAGVAGLEGVTGQSLLHACRTQAFSAVYEREEGADHLTWVGVETGSASLATDCANDEEFGFDLSADPGATTREAVEAIPDGPLLEDALSAYVDRIAEVLPGTTCGS